MATSRVVIPVLESLEQNDKPLVKTILKGVKQIQQQRIQSQSNNTNQTSFSFQPPSQNSVIDKCFMLEVQVGVARDTVADKFCSVNNAIISTNAVAAGGKNRTQNVFQDSVVEKINPLVSGTAGNGAAVAPIKDDFLNGLTIRSGNAFSLRQFPLTSAMSSIDLVVNGTHFSVSPSQYIHAVMSYTTPEWREANFRNTAHACDLHYKNQDVCGSGKDNKNVRRYEGRETPNGSLAHASADFSKVGLLTYGGGAGAITAANSGDTRMYLTLREPLFISPLMCYLGQGFTNVNNIDITIRWESNLAGLLFQVQDLQTDQGAVAPAETNHTNLGGGLPSAAANTRNLGKVDFGTLTSATASNPAYLYVNYYEAQDDVKIPNEIVLPYKQPQINSKQITLTAGTQRAGKTGTGDGASTVRADASTIVQGDNVRLNQIPDSVYLYAKLRNSNVRPQDNNHYAGIEKVDVQWKNRTGILSGFNRCGLERLARDNGWHLNEEDTKNIGLVLKLEYGKDIPLDDNESPGTRGDYNWKVDITFSEFAGLTDYTFYQVFVMNGHAIVSPNECRVMTGVLDLKDNVSASEMGHSYHQGRPEVAGGSMLGGSEVGGSLIGGAGRHLKKIMDMGSKASKVMGAVKEGCPDPMKAVSGAVKEYRSRA